MKLSDIWRLILIIFILLIPIMVLGGILVYRDEFNNLTEPIRNLVIFIYLLLIVVCLSVVFKSKMTKKLIFSSTINLRKQEWKRSQESISYSVDKNQYKGKTLRYCKYNRTLGMIVLLVTILLFISVSVLFKNFDIRIIGVFICIILLIYNLFIKSIIISPKGVKLSAFHNSQFISWDKVKSIGIYSPIGRKNFSVLSKVYITSKTYKHIPIRIDDTSSTITLWFNKKAIHHLLCYWDNEIINLEKVRRWRRYLNNTSK